MKVTARGRRFVDAAQRMERSLQEFRVRGVKVNVPFLIQLMQHPQFLAGECTHHFHRRHARAVPLAAATRSGDAAVELSGRNDRQRQSADERAPGAGPPRAGSRAGVCDRRDRFPRAAAKSSSELGPEKLAQWVLKQKPLLLTDTTFRDAHQSLLATRLRTRDLLNVAEAYARLCPDLFSIEMWGGATFDTTMRFLKESPWQRLIDLREKIPNILFQMLLRGSNAVGYSNYPDNVVKEFVREAAAAGIDVFRIFDSLNWVPNMQVAMEAVLKTGAICEAAICYTGDILDPRPAQVRPQVLRHAGQRTGKDGRPYPGHQGHGRAVQTLRGPPARQNAQAGNRHPDPLPHARHGRHSGGVDPQSGRSRSRHRRRRDGPDVRAAPRRSISTRWSSRCGSRRAIRGSTPSPCDGLADYWEAVRQFYTPFESVELAATSDLYRHEMPGGQYTNLFQQARALGLADRWAEVRRRYAEVNQLLGDIVKVTPTSKSVGDMALFLVANNLTVEDALDESRGSLMFGIAICHEGWRYPETVRFAARHGAHIVFHPHFHQAEPGSYQPSYFADPANSFHEKAALCRAAENTCFFATVNYASAGSPTTSAVIRPDGTLLCYQPYGKRGLLIADIGITEATGLLAARCKSSLWDRV